MAASELQQALKNGKVLLMPCDTIWGLVSRDAAPLRQIKGRPATKPFLQLFANLEQLRQSPWQLPPPALQQFWPGPLTCVLAAKEYCGSQAVRIPQHRLLQELATEGPLYSSSANRSGQATPPTTAALLREFAPEISAGLVIPYFPANLPQTQEASTIVDARCQPPRILRQGGLILPL